MAADDGRGVGDDGAAGDEAVSTGEVTNGGESAGGADGPTPSDGSPPSRPDDLGRGLFDETMGPGSALAHLYRGEIHRMKLWRERVDRTTEWAVMLIAALLTWAFSSPDNPHYLLLIGLVGLGAFLGIEARRFRGFDMWRSRVRVLQENVFARALDPSTDADGAWREDLGAHYRQPRVTVPVEEALAHRLRRVYLPLGGLVAAAWLARVTAFADRPWPASAAIDGAPGTVVTAAVALLVLVAVVVAFRPREWHVEGEIRSADADPLHDRRWDRGRERTEE